MEFQKPIRCDELDKIKHFRWNLSLCWSTSRSNGKKYIPNYTKLFHTIPEVAINDKHTWDCGGFKPDDISHDCWSQSVNPLNTRISAQSSKNRFYIEHIRDNVYVVKKKAQCIYSHSWKMAKHWNRGNAPIIVAQPWPSAAMAAEGAEI